eukprot:c47415_g1_i1 orf=393-626(+)
MAMSSANIHFKDALQKEAFAVKGKLRRSMNSDGVRRRRRQCMKSVRKREERRGGEQVERKEGRWKVLAEEKERKRNE